MPSTIEQAKEAILKYGGKARKQEIARELKIGLEYAGLICQELKRKREIGFSDGFYFLTSAQKGVTQDKRPKKPAIPSPARQAKKSKGIKKSRKPRVEKNTTRPLSSILGISELLARTLEKAGYNTVESLAEAPINKLMETAKLKLRTAAQLINQARKVK